MEQKENMHHSSDSCWNTEGWDGQDIHSESHLKIQY
jgi:hypothetical protein